MRLNNIISTTVNSKTGTKIVKELAEAFGNKNFVRTRVIYGENTPMVTKYGIKEIIKNKGIDDVMGILTTSGKNITFAPKNNWIGSNDAYRGSGTAKERFSQLLEMLKIMKLS